MIHCPTSNTFIGSGLFDMDGLMQDGHPDRAWRRTPAAARRSRCCGPWLRPTRSRSYAGTALHPAQLLWLATAGSADALRLGDTIGTLAPGFEADLIAVDLASTPAIAQRSARAETLWEAVFPTIMMGDDRAIAATYVAGQRV